MKKKTKFDVRFLVTLAMLTAILLVMVMTPLGTLPLGPLSVSFVMIPVAIGAIVLGPVGGMIMGGIFGIASYLQCYGIGVLSGMGAILVEINPFLAFVQRFVPRLLAGLLCGFVYTSVKKGNTTLAGYLTGFCAALFNTVLFMLSLVLCFGSTQYIQGLMGGRNVIVFICAFVGIQAVVEMIADTIIVGAISQVLSKIGRK